MLLLCLHIQHNVSADGIGTLLQERKLRTRLAQLQQQARTVDFEHALGCHGHSMLEKVEGILYDIEGFKRWVKFQKGMIHRAAATAQHELDGASGYNMWDRHLDNSIL